MATFTSYLHEVIDGGYDLGLKEYPIFDEAHRDTLNKKILDHYWNHEIGMETISMFQLAFKRRMNEIMPLWNQHYEISAIEFDPLRTIDMTTTSLGNGTTNTSSESLSKSDADSESKVLTSQYPQTRIDDNGKYATAGQDNESTTLTQAEAEERSSGRSESEQESRTTGYQGVPALMLYEFRQTLVNTDMEVINALDDLFMGIWSNGDEFTHPNMPNPFGLSPFFRFGQPFYN